MTVDRGMLLDVAAKLEELLYMYGAVAVDAANDLGESVKIDSTGELGAAAKLDDAEAHEDVGQSKQRLRLMS